MYYIVLHTSAYVVRDRAVRLSEAPTYPQARRAAAHHAHRLFGQTARTWPRAHHEFISQRYISLGIDRSHLFIVITTFGGDHVDV